VNKAIDAFRTIGEVADELDVPKHVLRFWEGKFPQIKPMKRGGGRRYYRPEDMELLRAVHHLLHVDGYTIRGVQKKLRSEGIERVKAGRGGAGSGAAPTRATSPAVATKPSVNSGARPAAARGRRPANGDLETLLRNAIRELEAVRSLLGGGAGGRAGSVRAADG